MYVIRCDAGNKANGWGHELRCRAIAEELEKLMPGRVVWQGNVVNNDTVIYDSRNDWPIRSHLPSVRVVTIDDPRGPYGVGFNPNVAFYPPTPQALRLDWTGYDTDVKIGWEWLPMRKLPEPLPKEQRRGVFVANDSFGILKETVCVWQTKTTSRQHGDAYLEAMNGSELVVCCGGMTAYEAHALGIPSIIIPPNEDVAESSIGLSRVPFGAIDGHGARRIAEYLVRTA